MKNLIKWLIEEEYNAFDLIVFYLYMSVINSPDLEAPVWFAMIVASIIIFIPWYIFSRVLLPYFFRGFLEYYDND